MDVIEHRHSFYVEDRSTPEAEDERWFASCSCGEVNYKGPFATRAKAERYLCTRHAFNGQLSYQV